MFLENPYLRAGKKALNAFTVILQASDEGRDSSVGIATDYGLDGPGIEFQWGRNFQHPSRPALGPTQAPVQWVPGFSGVKSGRSETLNPHPLLVPWAWNGRAIPLLPLWAVRPVQNLIACTRVHFTFDFYGMLLEKTYRRAGKKALNAFTVRLQASAAKKRRTALFWVITQWVVVITFWRFGTTSRSHQVSKILLGLFNLEYGTDMLSRNVSKELPLLTA